MTETATRPVRLTAAQERVLRRRGGEAASSTVDVLQRLGFVWADAGVLRITDEGRAWLEMSDAR
jgi:hypothetical protein